MFVCAVDDSIKEFGVFQARGKVQVVEACQVRMASGLRRVKACSEVLARRYGAFTGETRWERDRRSAGRW